MQLFENWNKTVFRFSSFAFISIVLTLAPVSGNADSYADLRRQMVELIRQDVIDTRQFTSKTVLDPRVMEVMGKVPRHKFVPSRQRSAAYRNHPLPIGYGQTISQPYIVALMTDLLQVRPGQKIFEVGTGSGYQAAVLAEMGAVVYTKEIIKPLALQVRTRLERLGYKNVHASYGDGYHGLQEQAPFDGIVVTAAAGHVPPPLVRQLKPGGRMIIPVGSRFSAQQLLVIEKSPQGTVTTRQILPVIFVPLTGQH